MKAAAFALVAVLFLCLGCVQQGIEGTQPGNGPEGGGLMQLLSNDLEHGGEIPAEFTCDGSGISPELHWQGAPAETKSFALVVSDPDAPAGTFYHWLVCNIPAGISSIPQGGPLPNGAKEVQNDYSRLAYGPPCPPSGIHRYYFRLYALDVETLECGSRQQLLQQAEQHKLAVAELVAPYSRE